MTIANNAINTNRASLVLNGRNSVLGNAVIQQNETGTMIIENFNANSNIFLNCSGTGIVQCNVPITFKILAGTGGTGQTQLDYYYQETVNANFTGAQTFTLAIKYKRVGTQVFMFIPSSTLVNATSATFLTANATVPLWARPIADVWDTSINVRVGANYASGLTWVSTGGSIVIYASANQGNFSNNQPIQIRSGSLTWLMA